MMISQSKRWELSTGQDSVHNAKRNQPWSTADLAHSKPHEKSLFQRGEKKSSWQNCELRLASSILSVYTCYFQFHPHPFHFKKSKRKTTCFKKQNKTTWSAKSNIEKAIEKATYKDGLSSLVGSVGSAGNDLMDLSCTSHLEPAVVQKRRKHEPGFALVFFFGGGGPY